MGRANISPAREASNVGQDGPKNTTGEHTTASIGRQSAGREEEIDKLRAGGRGEEDGNRKVQRSADATSGSGDVVKGTGEQRKCGR